MTETTSETQELSRDEVAAYLQRLGTEFEGDGEIDIDIDNKTVRLHPPAQITCETDVTEETGGLLSDEQETVQLTLSWEPQD